MEKENRLSKRLDWKIGMENGNNNQKLIKEEQIQRMMEIVVEEPEIMLVENQKSKRKIYRGSQSSKGDKEGQSESIVK